MVLQFPYWLVMECKWVVLHCLVYCLCVGEQCRWVLETPKRWQSVGCHSSLVGCICCRGCIWDYRWWRESKRMYVGWCIDCWRTWWHWNMWFLSEWDWRCRFHSIPVESERGPSCTWRSISEFETWCLGPGCIGLLQGNSIGQSWWLVLGSWREAWLLGDVDMGKRKIWSKERRNEREGLNRMLASQRESGIKISLGPYESDGQFSLLRFPSSYPLIS